MSKIFITNTGLTQYIEGNLNFLTNGYSMFTGCTNLTSFNCDMSSLTNGSNMFQSCTNLTSFMGDLSSLTDGTQMFYSCGSLKSFSSDLPSLTEGKTMFQNCQSLTSFKGDLSSLTNAYYMFPLCKSLTSFSSDLSSLTEGYVMFGNSTTNCSKLDLASVQNIAETINDLASKGSTGRINIGIAKALKSDDETAPVNVALATIRAKGWTVTEIYA